MRLFSVLFVLLFLVSGCSLLQKKIEKPSAKVVAVELQSLDFEQATLVMLVDVTNPNPISVPLRGFDYGLEIMDSPFLSGANHDKKSLKAESVTRIAVPVTVPFVKMYDSVKSSLDQNEVPYALSATVMLDLPILGETPLALRHQGKLPIPKWPTLSVQSVSVQDMSLTAVEIGMVFNLTNPNVFDIQLAELDYRLMVDNQAWASSQQKQQVTAKAGQNAQLVIPVKVRFKDIGMAFYRQLTSGGQPLDYRVVGESSIKALHPLLGEVDVPLDVGGYLQK